MKVVHFQRFPAIGQVSVERLFDEVRRKLPPDIDCSVQVCPYANHGLMPRLRNVRWARKNRDQVNHVTGDVHYLGLGLPGRSTLLTVLDCVSLRRLKGWRRTVFRHLWYTLPVRRASLVSVISEATRTELLREVHCDPGKVRVIHCCVRSEFTPAPKAFPESDPVLLQIGTGHNKNLVRVAQALTGLRCRLHVIGALNAEQRAALGEASIRYTNLPKASDAEVLEAYRMCDAVVFASTYEGFGLPIVEANAIGRPIVAGNVASMPEVARDAACLVDPFDVGSIRAGVRRILEAAGYRNELIHAGFANVRRFQPKAIADQYAALYREIAGT